MAALPLENLLNLSVSRAASLGSILLDLEGACTLEIGELERRVREETLELTSREKEVEAAETRLKELSEGAPVDNDQDELRREQEQVAHQKRYSDEKRKAKRKRRHGELDPDEEELIVVSSTKGVRSEEGVRELALDPERSVMQEPYFRAVERIDPQTYSHVHPLNCRSRDVALEQVIKECRHVAPLPPRDEDDAMDLEPELNIREDEEARLRTPFPGERPCREDENCVAYAWSGNKDVLVEWLNQAQRFELANTGKLPELPGKCLRCLRADVVYNYEGMRNLHKGCPGGQLICEFRNDIKHDYAAHHCYLPEDDDEHFHGLAYPVVTEIPSLYARKRIGETFLSEKYPHLFPGWLLKPFGAGHDAFLDDGVFPWRPIWPTSGARHRIYFELANRMAYLERVACLHEVTPHRALVRQWQDQYQSLSLYMEMSDFYADDEIDPFVAERLKPRPELAFSYEKMPDIFQHLLYVPYWGGETGIPFSSQADISMVNILEKAQCEPCGDRCYRNNVEGHWNGPGGEYVYDAISRIVAGAFLGVVPQATVLANFGVRRQIYRWYMFSETSRVEMGEWMEENKMLLTYCLREYCFACDIEMPSFNRFMSDQYYFWACMQKNTFDTMDETRAFLDDVADGVSKEFETRNGTRGFEFLRIKIPLSSKAKLDDLHQHNRRYTPRPVDGPFWKGMVTHVFGDVEKRAEKARLPPLPSPTDEEQGAELTLEHEAATKEIALYDLQDRYGIDPDFTLDLLCEGKRYYLDESNRTKIEWNMLEVRKRRPREYRLLRAYFTGLRRKWGLQYFDLPWHAMKRQLETLRWLYGVAPGEKLPEAAGEYFVCPNCMFFKAPVKGDRTRRSDEVRTALTNALTGEIKCCRTVPRHHAQKKQKSSSKARRWKRPRDNEACRWSTCTRVNLIGRIALSCEQKMIVICPECGILCTLGRCAYENGTLNCGCVQRPEKKISDCVLCKNPKIPIHPRFVFDDEAKPPTLRYAGLCDRHPCKWMLKYDTVLRLSYVRERYESRTFNITLSGGEKVDIKPRENEGGAPTMRRTTEK